MTSGLVNASFSLPEWQAVKMIFFAPCLIFHFILSKIVALIGKNPAFKLQRALYFFCDPLKQSSCMNISKQFPGNFVFIFLWRLSVLCESRIVDLNFFAFIFYSVISRGGFRNFLLGGGGQTLVQKGLLNFFCVKFLLIKTTTCCSICESQLP